MYGFITSTVKVVILNERRCCCRIAVLRDGMNPSGSVEIIRVCTFRCRVGSLLVE